MSENPDYNCASGREIAEIKTVLAAVVDSMTRNETEILNIEVFPFTGMLTVSACCKLALVC